MAVNMTRETMKVLTAHIIAVLLVLLLAAISLLAISGAVNLSDPAVSLFVGSLVGLIAGLLASPLQYYYGRAPKLPHGGREDVH